MRRVISCGLIVLMIMGICSFVYGEEQKTTYTKGERGFKNVALGWTEIPKTVLDTSKEKNVLVGLTVGTLKGIANAFARTISGAVDIVTMPAGNYQKQAIKPTMVEETK